MYSKGIGAILRSSQAPGAPSSAQRTVAVMSVVSALVRLRHHQIVAGGAALLQATCKKDYDHAPALRERLLKGVQDLEAVTVNGDLDQRVPHNPKRELCFRWRCESLLMSLKDRRIIGLHVHRVWEPSYVLRALGLNDELAHSLQVRFSFGRFNNGRRNRPRDCTNPRSGKQITRHVSLWDMYKKKRDWFEHRWVKMN